MKKRDFIELWTYGTYDEESDTDFGISFEVPKRWLKETIQLFGFKNLNEFLHEYDWDTTEQVLVLAESEGVLLNKKCGRFGHEIYKNNIRKINY